METFLEKMRNAHADVLDIFGSGQLTDDATKVVEATMADIAGQYK